MKKIIIGILSLAMLFAGQSASASVTWNNNSQGQDCPTINIATPNQGGTNGGNCWTGVDVSASAGEKVEVKIYYHNTGNETADNTHIVLYGPTNTTGQSSFYAKIVSDQGNLTSSTVKVTYPSSQTINYDYTTWWTKHDPINNPYTLSPTTFLNGQDGSEVFSSEGGLYIGAIENNWADQGAVVVTFHVSNTQPQSCSIDNFSANPTSITSGNSSTLSWNTSDCTTVKLNNSTVSLDGSQTVWPTTTTTYTLKAYNSNGTLADTATATVTVNQPQVCSIDSFNANPPSITYGNSSTLSWNTTNCTSVKLNGNTVSVDGSQVVSPLSTTTYTLTASNTNSSDTDYVTVNVSSQPQMTGTITAAHPTCSIASGASTCNITFTWSTQNPVGTSAVTHNGQTVATGNNGTKLLSVSHGSQTYYLYNSGINLDQETVVASCASGTSWNGSKCTPNTNPTICNVKEFSANPTSINDGESSLLRWVTEGCASVTLNGSEVNLSGTNTVYPHTTTTYTLRAYSANTGGTSSVITRKVTVEVQEVTPNTCYINYFSADPTSINDGESSLLKWETTGCTSVKLDGTSVSTSGTRTVWPSNTTTYTLVAKNNYNEVSEKVTVSVDEPNNNNCRIVNFDASDTSIDEGDYSILEWETEDCSKVKISHVGDVNDDGTKKVYPDSDTTYVLTAYNEDGSTETASIRIYVEEENNDDDSCTINSFTASDTYIDEGDEVTLKWRTTGCDDEVYITDVGDVDEDGSEDIYPSRTTTYTLRARGNGDSDSDSIKITVGSSWGVVYNANVVTTVATNISQNSAQLNGLLTGSNSNYGYGSTNTYFEYGTSVYLGSRTSSRTTGMNNSFSDYVSGLTPNTIYYFRAVSNDSGSTSYGAIEIFKTLGYTNTYVSTGTTKIIREVVNQGTTVIGAESPVVLRIENRYQMIGIGDTIDYVVFYKNISDSRLSNPMVQVYIPEGITLINHSAGTYSEDNRTLSVPIGDLYPDEEGVIYLQARVDALDSNLAQMVTTAMIIYTTPNGAQENVMAYVLNNPKLTNLLGASVIGSGLFLGMNLVGWLLLITFILLLILLVRTFYARREVEVATIHHQ